MRKIHSESYSTCSLIAAILFVALCGCQEISITQPQKAVSFYLLYKSDTIRFTFTTDSSLNESPGPIQWGYMKTFEFKNQNTELFFGFHKNEGRSISRYPDSLLVNDLKDRLTTTPKQGKLSDIRRIANNRIYGFWGEFEKEDERVAYFEGEAVSVRRVPLFIEIVVYQKKTGQPLPDILGDVLKTLQIQVSDQ